jgi:hypothetical protein
VADWHDASANLGELAQAKGLMSNFALSTAKLIDPEPCFSQTPKPHAFTASLSRACHAGPSIRGVRPVVLLGDSEPPVCLAATSGGSLTQDAVVAPAAAKTIFEFIDDPANPATFRIYTNGPSGLMTNLYLARPQNKFFDYSRFLDDCQQNLLPEFTFIEPSYDSDLRNGIFATSQHTDFAMDAGEALISEV